MEQFRSSAQTKVDGVAQATTRWMAFGLAGVYALLGLLHGVVLPGAQMQALFPLALVTGAVQTGAALWLRRPRPFQQLRICEGTVALFAVGTGLLDLALSEDVREALQLLLIQVGAGFFVLSTYWFAAVSLALLGGWCVLAWPLAAPAVLPFGIALACAHGVAWLLHLSRRRMLRDMVELEMRELATQADQRRLAEELQAALDRIRTLKGLIPICAKCKKIRDDQGFWQQVEVYVEAHSHAAFSHGLCPHCLEEARAEWERTVPEEA